MYIYISLKSQIMSVFETVRFDISWHTHHKSVGRTLSPEEPQRQERAPRNNSQTSKIHKTAPVKAVDISFILFEI